MARRPSTRPGGGQQIAILEQELRIAPTGECLLVERLGGEVVGLVTANLVALLELVPIHAGLALPIVRALTTTLPGPRQRSWVAARL
jgi:hypothetical protein